MDLPTLETLCSPAGTAALAVARALRPTWPRYPACVDRLAKSTPRDLARAAVEAVLLREKALAKFPDAGRMFFTRDGYEMASGHVIARHRAERFRPFASVADLGCGVGGDTLALARLPADLLAVDRDPLALRMARANVEALVPRPRPARFLAADLLTLPLEGVGAAFADPSRRVDGRRTLSVEDAEPPLSALRARFDAGFPLGVKVAPGLPRHELLRLAGDAEAEFISVEGELKECVLWFGPLRTAHTRATVLPTGDTLTGDPAEVPPSGELGQVLYDPDPTVSRSGLLAALARRVGAWCPDPGLALLSADAAVATPFATAFTVLARLPADRRTVGAWLQAHDIGRVTMVKRGSDLDSEAMRASWKLKGAGHCEVILTRLHGEPAALVARRV